MSIDVLQIGMIASFRHKGLRRFFESGDTRGIDAEHAGRIRTILTVLDVAESLDELMLPTYRLHDLAGDLKGFKSVTVRRIGALSSDTPTARHAMSILSITIEALRCA